MPIKAPGKRWGKRLEKSKVFGEGGGHHKSIYADLLITPLVEEQDRVIGDRPIQATDLTGSALPQLETPPGELARLKWEQAKSAAASGANTWRTHPHNKVRLVRRSS